jgi:hypothetical protein
MRVHIIFVVSKICLCQKIFVKVLLGLSRSERIVFIVVELCQAGWNC